MHKSETDLKKYIFNCMDSLRGWPHTIEDSLEMILALHMLREIVFSNNYEEHDELFFDLDSFSESEISHRFEAHLNMLKQSQRPEYFTLADKIEYLIRDSRLLLHLVQLSASYNWGYVVTETKSSLNQTVISLLLTELLEKQGRRGSLGVLSDYACEIVSNIFETYNVDEVYDPCAGSSKLALYAATRTAHSENEYNKLIVRDINSTSIFLTLARFLSKGVTNYDIKQVDSLSGELPPNKRFSSAVFFPPIRMDASRYKEMYYGFPFFIKSDATSLFIESTLHALKDDGVAIAVLPESFLIAKSRIAQYRKELINNSIIKCVIKLPMRSLLNTGVQMSLVLFNKFNRSDHVRIIDASNSLDQQAHNGYSNLHSPEDIAALAIGYNSQYNEDICTDIPLSDLAKNDGILSFNYYKQFSLHNKLIAFSESLNNTESYTCTLKDICQVQFGRKFSRELISTEKSLDSIPLLKIGDIKAIDRITSKSWVKFDGSKRLLALLAVKNSIVFSIQGTIGKLALINEGQGYFPSSGIAVIKVNEEVILPEYLAAYLSSESIKEWLETVSSSYSTMRRIDNKQLKKLPVVIPSLEWQKLVAKEFSENKTDAIDSLRLLANDLNNKEFIYPLQKINKFISGFLANTKSKEYLEFFSYISKFRYDLDTFELGKYNDYEKGQISIINDLKGILKIIDNLRFVSRGSSQLSILNIVNEKLNGLANKLEDNLYFCSLISSICRGIKSSINGFITQSHNAGTLLIKLSSHRELDNGEIEVALTNTFKFPLINIKIESEILKENKIISYIDDGSKAISTFNIDEERLNRIQAISLKWLAYSFDNMVYQGETELVGLKVRDNKSQMEWTGSPYITGDPVKPNQKMHLYGRDDILGSISRYISESGNVVLLEGNRRVGKSSILYHLQSNDYIPGWICVYMSLQECEGCDKSGIPAWSIWQVMASQIVIALVKAGKEISLPDGEIVSSKTGRFYQTKIKKAIKELISIDSPFYDFQSYLEELLEELKASNTGIVIMIDEFDKLQEGIDNEVTTPQVPENIRSIIHRYDNFSAILTGSKRLQRLREEYWSALFGLGIRIGLAELALPNARQLVIEPSKGQLNFTAESVDLIVEQTGKYPFLIQCLCNKIYDNAAKSNLRQIDTKFASKAISEFIKDNEHFMYFWNLTGMAPGDTRSQLILFIFAREEKDGNRLTSGELLEALIESGVDLSEKLFEQFINYLMELELIERRGERGEQVYSLTTPLLSKWLLESQDYERVLASARQEFEKD
ncbi:MAG: type I restriction enzyme M protein [Cocleimonas sp.]|jgi:type I restriction enzyme M protein